MYSLLFFKKIGFVNLGKVVNSASWEKKYSENILHRQKQLHWKNLILLVLDSGWTKQSMWLKYMLTFRKAVGRTAKLEVTKIKMT